MPSTAGGRKRKKNPKNPKNKKKKGKKEKHSNTIIKNQNLVRNLNSIKNKSPRVFNHILSQVTQNRLKEKTASDITSKLLESKKGLPAVQKALESGFTKKFPDPKASKIMLYEIALLSGKETIAGIYSKDLGRVSEKLKIGRKLTNKVFKFLYNSGIIGFKKEEKRSERYFLQEQ